MADAVVLNYNDAETTEVLVKALYSYEHIQHICVVDNASTDGSFLRLKALENNKIDVVQTDRNGGYGYGNNYGIRYLANRYQSAYILLSNPDVIIEDQVIEALEHFLRSHDEYMIAAPFMLGRDGNRQSNTAFKIESVLSYILSFSMFYGKIFKPGQYNWSNYLHHQVVDVDAVAGSLFMFDTQKMLAYGMYDENIFLYCEERMLGMKCQQAGLKIGLLPQYTFIHNHSVSINKTIGSEVKKRKVMNKSAQYVIKHYYKASAMMRLLARLMMNWSLLEMYLLEKVREMRRR